MFESHFGFKTTPFSRQVPLEALYLSAAHRELLSRLRFIAERRGVMLLTGEVGAGKSTALRQLKGTLDPTRYEVIYLADVAFTPRSFFQTLLEALHVEVPYQTARAKAAAQKALLERFRTDHRTPVLLVDEAQALPNALLDQLRTLLNYDCDAFSPLALVLSGTKELAQRLALRHFEPLAQRITLRYHLEGFSPQETAAYIRHQVKRAGVDHELFTEEALRRIHQATGGLARRINQVALLCLMSAAASGRKLIDDGWVDQVLASEVEQLTA